jgi:dipeptidyl aminopeptidase/acylaminoacyl peptidase
MRSLAARPNIRAAVIWAGAVYTYEDMQKYGIDDNSYQPPPTTAARSRDRQRLRELYGDFDPDSSFWKTVAVTDYLKNLKGAIQVNHAVDDPVVDIGYSRDLMKLLDATSVPHELMEYSSGGHNISGPNFTKAMENTVEFFKKHL